MLKKTQVQPLLDAITKLQNANLAENPNTLSELLQEVIREKDKVDSIDQTVAIGLHTHQFGISASAFLVPAGVEFSNSDAVPHFPDFEADKEEEVSVEKFADHEFVRMDSEGKMVVEFDPL